MRHVQLDDQLFNEVQLRASEAGFSTVDEYVVQVLIHDVHEATADLDPLFTAERLAHIDRAESLIKAGNYYDAGQADTELANRRTEWLQKNPG